MPEKAEQGEIHCFLHETAVTIKLNKEASESEMNYR
jgi:hypothetical protein